jgi:hypothetical protein
MRATAQLIEDGAAASGEMSQKVYKVLLSVASQFLADIHDIQELLPSASFIASASSIAAQIATIKPKGSSSSTCECVELRGRFKPAVSYSTSVKSCISP